MDASALATGKMKETPTSQGSLILNTLNKMQLQQDMTEGLAYRRLLTAITCVYAEDVSNIGGCVAAIYFSFSDPHIDAISWKVQQVHFAEVASTQLNGDEYYQPRVMQQYL